MYVCSEVDEAMYACSEVDEAMYVCMQWRCMYACMQ